jgi:hypothetical protein
MKEIVALFHALWRALAWTARDRMCWLMWEALYGTALDGTCGWVAKINDRESSSAVLLHNGEVQWHEAYEWHDIQCARSDVAMYMHKCAHVLYWSISNALYRQEWLGDRVYRLAYKYGNMTDDDVNGNSGHSQALCFYAYWSEMYGARLADIRFGKHILVQWVW